MGRLTSSPERCELVLAYFRIHERHDVRNAALKERDNIEEVGHDH